MRFDFREVRPVLSKLQRKKEYLSQRIPPQRYFTPKMTKGKNIQNKFNVII